MRFRDLHIETRREAPARAKTPGIALLMRAGYLSLDGQPTELGSRAIEQLHLLAQSSTDLFSDLGLEVSRSGGGELVFLSPTGEMRTLRCGSCGYSSSEELAQFRKPSASQEPMRPLQRISTPDCSTIEALSKFLGIPKEGTAKALMYARIADGQFVFVVVRGDMQISEAKLRRLVGDIQPAGAEHMAQAGAVPGYASPIGLEGALVVVDDLIPKSPNLVAGANEAGFHLNNTNCGRDYQPQIVADLVQAESGDPCAMCGNPLVVTRADLLADAQGYRFTAVLQVLAEIHHDERGLCLPASAAPFAVYLMQIPSKTMDTRAASDEIQRDLEAAGVSVLYDDREERAGVKFNDADLIGCPLRLTVGEKGLKDGMVESKRRRSDSAQLIARPDIVNAVGSSLGLRL